jgi:hypothetical protein
MGLQGGCMCGAVRYEASGEPFNATLCHCVDCRRASGAPALAWFSVRRDTLHWTRGSPARNASSPGVERLFCGQCGTQLTWDGAGAPGEIDVTVCSLDDPEAVAPADHTFASQQLRWLHLADTLPRYARTRSDGITC